MREYTIYLPLKYNDGKDIEVEKLRRVKEELVEAFGAITVSSLSALIRDIGTTAESNTSIRLSRSKS